jgi:hypothetical protein
MDFDGAMMNMSTCLRQLSVDTLLREDLVLVMEGNENTTTAGLLQTVAEHYNISARKYCANMRLCHTWGGGPEIVALSNALERPIHVYELCIGGIFSKSFALKACARFGTPHFNDKTAIHILCADGRFPNLTPGHHKRVGDHFLALFDEDHAGKLPAEAVLSSPAAAAAVAAVHARGVSPKVASQLNRWRSLRSTMEEITKV